MNQTDTSESIWKRHTGYTYHIIKGVYTICTDAKVQKEILIVG